MSNRAAIDLGRGAAAARSSPTILEGFPTSTNYAPRFLPVDDKRLIIDALVRDGFACIEGLSSDEAVITLCRHLGRVSTHPDADERGVTVISPERGAAQGSYGGLTSSALYPHTDRSTLQSPPTLMLLRCRTPAEHGGMSIFVDGRQLYAQLVAMHPEASAAVRGERAFIAYDGTSMYVGPLLAPLSESRLLLRFRKDSAAFFSVEVALLLDAVMRLVAKLALTFFLPPDHGIIINNHRWLHGRTRFDGQRVFNRLLVEPWADGPIQRGFDFRVP